MFTPRPYQPPAARYLAARQRSMVQAPAGCGKTVIVSMALDMALSETPLNLRVGWIANTTEQVSQAQAALALFPRIQEQAEVTVACAAAARDWSECDLLIVDECHRSPAEGWSAQIATCRGAIWGMTATPPDVNDERYYAFARIFGEYDTWHIITREEVGQNLAHAKVVMLDASDPNLAEVIDRETEKAMRYRRRWHKGDEGELYGQVCWTFIAKYGIAENKARNNQAIEIAKNNKNRHILMLVNQIEHALEMQSKIQNSVAVYSKMPSKKRKEGVELFRIGKINVLIGTSLCDEGFDAQICDGIILLSGGKSKRLAEQRTGRALRSLAGKKDAIIWDWEDTYHKVARSHSLQRQSVYKNLGYEFDNSNRLLYRKVNE
jgi:superfamily II DNA or RNA helicase